VSSQRIPLAMRIGFTLWMLFWAPNMLLVQGPQNFLWLCNAAMFLILVVEAAHARDRARGGQPSERSFRKAASVRTTGGSVRSPP
jgi:hypothetical protein